MLLRLLHRGSNWVWCSIENIHAHGCESGIGYFGSCRKAAEQGDAESQLHSGMNHFDGEGAPRDYIQAYIWTSLSIAGLGGDQLEIATGLREGRGVET